MASTKKNNENGTTNIDIDFFGEGGDIEIDLQTSESGTANHANLYNLDYEHSGHTGFQPAGDYVKTEELDEILKSQHLVFTQAEPADEWVIEHNLGYFPHFMVVDSAGTVIDGEYSYQDKNVVVIRFNGSFSGRVFVN